MNLRSRNNFDLPARLPRLSRLPSPMRARDYYRIDDFSPRSSLILRQPVIALEIQLAYVLSVDLHVSQLRGTMFIMS